LQLVAQHEVRAHDIMEHMLGNDGNELHADAAAVAIDFGATDPVGQSDDLKVIVGRKDRWSW